MRESFEYYTYIVRCSDGSYYTGVTNDYHRRLREHNEGRDPTSYTHSRRPVELMYVTCFEDVYDAIGREKQIKGWNRKKKEALIAQHFDALPELSKRKKRRG